MYGMMKDIICGSFKPYWTCRGMERIVGIRCWYGLAFLRLEPLWDKRFSVRHTLTGPGSHLASQQRVPCPFPVHKVAGCGVDHPPPSSLLCPSVPVVSCPTELSCGLCYESFLDKRCGIQMKC
jgi:hypothetical protein